MEETRAKEIISTLCDVSRETWRSLETLVSLIQAEALQQNLVSAASLRDIWSRHILDSAQLISWDPGGRWLDIGSGPGLPGLVVAAMRRDPVVLVEPRRLRADFLRRAATAMDVADQVSVVAGKVEALPDTPKYDVISARAFASLDRVFSAGYRLSHLGTRWILPKGRGAQAEVEAARDSWQGGIEIVASLSDPESGVVIARNIQPSRKSGSKSR